MAMLQEIRKAFGVQKEHRKHRAIKALIADLRPLTPDVDLVRYGPDADGGYLIPDDLEDIGASISPGVSSECGFDLEIAERGIPVHMADGSVTDTPVSHPHFRFSKRFLDTYNSDTTIRINDYCEGLAPGKDLLLQMDIEGAEFRVLNSATDAVLDRFRIMVIEFHDLDGLFTTFGFREISSLFRRLLRTHAVVHIHPNNCRPPVTVGSITIPIVVEFTFYRRDRSTFRPEKTPFPRRLDRPNLPDRPDFALPPLWHY